MATVETKPALVFNDQPDDNSDLAHKRTISRLVHSIIQYGRVQWVNEFTLATGATSTTVADERITLDCQISLMPLTPAAAALMSKVWIAKIDLTPALPWTAAPGGQFVVEHPSLAAGVVATFRSSVKG